MNIPQLPAVTNAYLSERDNYLARYKFRQSGLSQGSLGGPMGFNKLVTGHAVNLAAALPPLTPDQWEGLSELVSSYCAHLRMTSHKDPT